MEIYEFIISEITKNANGIYTEKLGQLYSKAMGHDGNNDLLKKLVDILLKLREGGYVICEKKGRDYLWTPTYKISEIGDKIIKKPNNPKNTNKILPNKLVIVGNTGGLDIDDYFVTCTVKNNDTKKHNVFIKIIFNDKDKNPIIIEESSHKNIDPGEIEVFKVEASEYEWHNATEEIDSYDMFIKELN